MEENVIQQTAVQQAAQPEAQPVDAAQPGEQAEALAEGQPDGQQADEPEDPDKLPSWAKKRLRNAERRIGTLTKRLGGAEERLRSAPISDTNQSEQDDSEPLSLSRKELADLIQQEAKKLAPRINEQDSVMEQRRQVAESLAKGWGQERFDALASDLDAAFDGLTDSRGRPKAATDAIFEADDPKSVIEFLTDPDNAAEAALIARMSAVQAGKAIAKLEFKLSANKTSNKPQASKVTAPIESERGRGSINSAPDPSNTKAWVKWANEQEARARNN